MDKLLAATKLAKWLSVLHQTQQCKYAICWSKTKQMFSDIAKDIYIRCINILRVASVIV
jgi:hypothetical protein